MDQNCRHEQLVETSYLGKFVLARGHLSKKHQMVVAESPFVVTNGLSEQQWILETLHLHSMAILSQNKST